MDNRIRKIINYGDKYVERHLTKYRSKKLTSDWWEALKFFFDRSFYQGRRDIISEKVEEKAIEVLGGYFDYSNKRDTQFQRLKNNNWVELSNDLKREIGKGKIGKERDVQMVISTLNFISRLDHKNIVLYSTNKIKNGRIKELYSELQKSKNADGIISVGPKIASFYLRDLICLFNLEKNLSKEDQIFILPVDTWVRKVANELEIINYSKLTPNDLKNIPEKVIREKIVEKCNELSISIIKFNQGAWYLGYYSLDILLENLEKID